MIETTPRAPRLSLRIGVLALIACGPAFSGCGGEEGHETVVIDGSSTVFPISRAAQEAFDRENKSVEVVVDKHGTGGGFIRYLQNEVDIVDASRPAKAEEENKAKAQGLEWARFLVGYDGITVVVHPSNDFAKGLSVAQLKKLWSPEAEAKTWKDLDPSWPDRPIKLYSPDKNSGTFEFFTEAIVGKAGSQREDVQASPDDNVLVRGVAGDPDALGYFGFSYFKANADKLRAVSIRKEESSPAVEPSLETILGKSYTPLSRPLFIYVKQSALRRPGVAAFVRFYLDRIEELATKGGYVAPTPEDIAANKATLGPAGGATKPAA